MNELMNHGGDCRTALATPGLLIIHYLLALCSNCYFVSPKFLLLHPILFGCKLGINYN